MFATRTSEVVRTAVAVLVASVVLAAGSGAQAARTCDVRFVSPEAALDQGLGAYRAGFYSIAAPALTCAAERGSFLAQYHLARLYADSASTLTDHRRAYELFRKIVEEHAATIDVDDDGRAPYVGKALTAYAGYWLRGLPEIGLSPNPEQAAFFLQQAATFFRDPDAQFELAKLYLKGEGVPEDPKKALNWLAVLTQEAHAGAQAFFADLLWRGKIVPKDEQRALALITVAVENAPAHERIWIEDIYQSVFCGTSAATRKQSEGLVAAFRKLYAPRSGIVPVERFGLGHAPTRTCIGGEVVDIPSRERAGPPASALLPGSGGRDAGPLPADGGMLGVRDPSRR